MKFVRQKCEKKDRVMCEWLDNCTIGDKLHTNRPNGPQDWRSLGDQNKITMVVRIWEVKQKEFESIQFFWGGEGGLGEYHFIVFV